MGARRRPAATGAVALAIAGLVALGGARPAAAEETQPGDRLTIVDQDGDGGYRASQNYGAVRDRVIKARLLERLRDFLAPVRLPRSVGVIAGECNGGEYAAPFYNNSSRVIAVCYQFVALLERLADRVVAAAQRDPQHYPFPITREEFVWGLLGAVLLHESGHALFDVLDVPLFGREEDAADQFAILVALQLRPALAEAAVKSFAYYWRMTRDPASATGNDGRPHEDFSDEHGTASQRLYNGLCMAYGYAPATFGKFLAAGWLPESRAKGCAREYAHIAAAFAKTVLPFVDAKRLAEVQGINWLAATYGPAQTAPAAPAAKTTSTGPAVGQGLAGRGSAQRAAPAGKTVKAD
jgi:hypothetical protein